MPVLPNGTDGKFAFEANESVVGFRLADQLEMRLGAPDMPRYVVRVNVSLSQRAAAITADGDTSRFNIIGRADWAVSDIGTNDAITSGTVESFTSYSATGSTIATQTTQDDARARLAIILGDMIATRLMAQFLTGPA